MTTYAYPNHRPTSVTWSMMNNVAIFRNPFNAGISTMDRDGERWLVQMAYDDIWGDKLRELRAFLYKLNGAQHRFTMQDFGYARAGVGGGSPQVAGASQTGKTINLDGGASSTSGWLLAGDKISINNQMYSVDSDVNTGGGGSCTVSVSPRIFVAPSDNAAVEIDTPVQLLVLDVASIAISTRAPDISRLSFRAEGALT